MGCMGVQDALGCMVHETAYCFQCRRGDNRFFSVSQMMTKQVIGTVRIASVT